MHINGTAAFSDCIFSPGVDSGVDMHSQLFERLQGALKRRKCQAEVKSGWIGYQVARCQQLQTNATDGGSSDRATQQQCHCRAAGATDGTSTARKSCHARDTIAYGIAWEALIEYNKCVAHVGDPCTCDAYPFS